MNTTSLHVEEAFYMVEFGTFATTWAENRSLRSPAKAGSGDASTIVTRGGAPKRRLPRAILFHAFSVMKPSNLPGSYVTWLTER